MKREVERQRRLPAFSLSIGELEALVDRLLALFDDPSRVDLTIDIQLPSEQLQFSSVEELREYKSLPPQLTSFSLWLSRAGRRVWFRSARSPFSPAEVSAKAESEAWCAGAIDTAHSFVAARKLWYHWFVSAPIGWLLFGLGNLPTVALALLPSGYTFGRVVLFAWVGVFLALFLLYFGREKVFPSGLIRLRESDGGFVRKHVAELSLAIALVSAVLTVVGWFVAE